MPLAEGVFREYTTDYRTDVIEIPLGSLEELEYKLGLNEGDAIVYQWDAVDLKIPSCCGPSSTAIRRRSTTPAT